MTIQGFTIQDKHGRAIAFSYDLYNTDTELVEATEYKLPDDVRQLNNILRNNGEPQRWVATP